MTIIVINVLWKYFFNNLYTIVKIIGIVNCVLKEVPNLSCRTFSDIG